jgi:hypothetical protein
VAGRNPEEAVRNFTRPLRQVVGCVTNAEIVLRGEYRPGALYTLSFNRGDPFRISRTGGRAPLDVGITQHCRIVPGEGARGPWKVRIAAYDFYILEGGRDLVAYHWHPDGVSPIKVPHLHLRSYQSLSRTRLPTGRISVEQFVRLLIAELGVVHRVDDWDATIGRTQQLFETWRTWS